MFIADYHDGTRTDMASVLVHLGQNSILTNFTLNEFRAPINFGKITNLLSDTIKMPSLNDIMNETSIKINYEFYKNCQDFKDVDFVICSFPSSLCEAFIPLNKTIIFNPAHRYNLARCRPEKWEQLFLLIYNL